MADISIVSRLVQGIPRDVNLQNNSLVVGSLKVGTTSPAELTKAILERLISLQNGSDVDSSYHTHDGRYFTETELQSTTNGSSGGTKIGISGTPTNYTPTANTTQGHLEGIDSALAAASGTAFSDSLFRIQDNGDATKQIAFEASGIATGTVRTITMPNANVNLADVNQALLQDGTRPLLANLDANGNKLLNLAQATAAGQAVEYAQWQAGLAGLDFQPDVNDYVADATTTAPGAGLPAAATGQRYILASNTGSLHANWGSITGVGDNDIVEYNGSDWVVAYDVSVQGEGALTWNVDDNYWMRWDGSTWTEFGGLSGVTAGNGLEKSGNTIFLNFNELAGVAVASGDEFAFGDVSDSNIVKKITFASLNSSLDHDALGGFVANEHIDHSSVQIATAAGSGLAGGGDITTTRNLTVDITGQTEKTTPVAADEVMIWSDADSARRKVKWSNFHKNVVETEDFVAGESFDADTTYTVRLAISGETAGRVYKADYDASSSNKFYVIGVIQPTAAVSAGDTVSVIIKGLITLAANDTAFDSGEIGQPVHLKAAGAWDAIGAITYVTDQASFRFGYVKTTTQIYMDGSKQLNGIAG